MAALTNFANITLSSLYFDITKDCLYADHSNSIERRGVITVFEHILSTITSVMAPVLPHLAEEIHEHWKTDGRSLFTNRWVPLVSTFTAAKICTYLDGRVPNGTTRRLQGPCQSISD